MRVPTAIRNTILFLTLAPPTDPMRVGDGNGLLRDAVGKV